MKRFISFLGVLIIVQKVNSQDLQKYVDSLILKQNIPQIGYAVVSKDSIIEIKTTGFHRNDLKTAQTKASLSNYFHLGSNTKAITGFVAAYLVEKNKINWNTLFFDIFPTWKPSSNLAFRNITLADLLSHRANIQPYTSGLEFQKLPKFKGNIQQQREQFAKHLLNKNPVINNDKVFNYSNAGYSIAAIMLEKVSGLSWEQLVKNTMQNLLEVNVEFGFPNKLNDNQPFGHWVQNDSLIVVESNVKYNLALAEPAGDISMTLPDYAKFIQFNLKELQGQNNVLKATTYNYLHYGLNNYAIGWGNVNTEKKQFSEHAGSAGTFFCYTVLEKKANLAYIVVANSATKEAQQGVLSFWIS